jgi:hypothetical protein
MEDCSDPGAERKWRLFQWSTPNRLAYFGKRAIRSDTAIPKWPILGILASHSTPVGGPSISSERSHCSSGAADASWAVVTSRK